MNSHDRNKGNGEECRGNLLGISEWWVPYERLEAIIPELPMGLGGALFESVNLCIDVGSVIDGLGKVEARALARDVLGLIAYYRDFFWERQGGHALCVWSKSRPTRLG